MSGRGQGPQDWVEAQCRRWSAEGVAWIRRITPPARIVGGRRGQQPARLIFEAGGPPDFLGFLAGGRGIMFDVKSTRAERYHWPQDGRVPTRDRQLADLEVAASMGVLAGLAIAFLRPLDRGNPPEWVWVPASRARELTRGTWPIGEVAALGSFVGGGITPYVVEAALAWAAQHSIEQAGLVRRMAEELQRSAPNPRAP